LKISHCCLTLGPWGKDNSTCQFHFSSGERQLIGSGKIGIDHLDIGDVGIEASYLSVT
jgi:hypothetical protein